MTSPVAPASLSTAKRIRVLIARKRGPKKHIRPAFEAEEVAFHALEHAVAS